MDNTMLAGLMGILGGIISAAVVSILSGRKNNAEIDRLQAETKRINLELENVQNSWYRELLSKLHEYVHNAIGRASYLTRPIRDKPVLAGKSDEEILSFFQDTYSEFEISQLLKALDKDAYLSELEAWHEYLGAKKAEVQFHNFLISKKIFIDDEELLSACFELDNLLVELLNITEWNVKKIVPGNLNEAHSRYNNNVGPIVKKIEECLKPHLKHKTVL